eukprot:1521062-Prymnesium_polylepis.1
MTAGTWLGAQHEDHLSREQKIRWAAIFAGLCLSLCDSGAAFARTAVTWAASLSSCSITTCRSSFA